MRRLLPSHLGVLDRLGTSRRIPYRQRCGPDGRVQVAVASEGWRQLRTAA